jgi:MinD superfamily P-loop ATPase
MIISVASCKGGTGKTLVATSLVLSLKDKQKVQLLDCDVEEPNDHLFIKPVISNNEVVNIQVPRVNENKCTYCGRCAQVCAYHAIAVFSKTVLIFPELCHGCGACSYLCPEKAITEVGREIGVVEYGYSDGIDFVQGRLNVGEPMPAPVIRKVKEKACQESTVIVDVSPGTSCPVVQSIKDSDFCLLVTEPTPFGLNDLTLAEETVKELGVPCGVVVNRAGTNDKKIEEYCSRENIPIMLAIPLDIEIARLYSQGIALVEGIPRYKQDFEGLFDRIREILDERSRRLKR